MQVEDPPATAPARLAGRTTVVRVRFSNHAVRRFVERLRPGLDNSAAAEQLRLIAPEGEVQVGPPDWGGRPTSFLYLVVGDVCFPLDVDERNPETLVAMTCLVRGMRRSKRHARRRTRNPRRRHPGRAADLPHEAA